VIVSEEEVGDGAGIAHVSSYHSIGRGDEVYPTSGNRGRNGTECVKRVIHISYTPPTTLIYAT